MARPKLPDFERPPVTEVALSMQFEPLTDFRAIHLGLFWLFLGKDMFPETEEQPPLNPMFERIGLPRTALAPRVQLLNIPPLPRYLFISESGSEVLQVQSDRLTFNWRKRTESDLYPRYEYIAEKFRVYADKFELFLAAERIGKIKVTQAEVSYVNQVEMVEAPGHLEKVVSIFSGAYSDEFLSDPEETHLSVRYPIRTDTGIAGRLYVECHPSGASESDTPIAMTLLARGKPAVSDLDGAMAFFDLARKWIVSGFTSITSKDMHIKWGRRDNEQQPFNE
jgi:uncharacterized protein (TIGR04255 family)